jgi:tellurite resistance protein TerC
LEWIIYIFGVVLIITRISLQVRWPPRRTEESPGESSQTADAGYFDLFRPALLRLDTQGTVATPLFLVLLVIEWSDLVFAIDSIPAVFAITRDPSSFTPRTCLPFSDCGPCSSSWPAPGAFAYLKPAALILVFVGAKMVGGHWVHMPTGISLESSSPY